MRHSKRSGAIWGFLLIALASAVAGAVAGPAIAGPDPNKAKTPTGIIDTIAEPLSKLPGPIGTIGTILFGISTFLQRKRAIANAQRADEAEQLADAIPRGIDRALGQGTLPTVAKADLYKSIATAVQDMCSDPDAAMAFIAQVKADERA